MTTQYQPPSVAPTSETPRKRRRWLPWLGALAAFLLGVGLGNASNGGSKPATESSAPAVTQTATTTVTAAATTVTAPPQTVTAAPPAAKTVFDDGTFTVGTDIQPGTYKAANTSGTCYWARLKDTSGELGAIIASDIGAGAQTVTIKATDKAFKSSRCGGWAKVG